MPELDPYTGKMMKYWEKNTPIGIGSMLSAESWADYCALRATNGKDALAVLDEVAPVISAALKKTYLEVFGA